MYLVTIELFLMIAMDHEMPTQLLRLQSFDKCSSDETYNYKHMINIIRDN